MNKKIITLLLLIIFLLTSCAVSPRYKSAGVQRSNNKSINTKLDCSQKKERWYKDNCWNQLDKGAPYNGVMTEYDDGVNKGNSIEWILSE